MTYEQNVKAILECNLPVVDPEVIDRVTKRIVSIKEDNRLHNQGLMKIGDEIYVRANINEIRKDYVICENAGGYFGTVMEEIYRL